MSSQAGRGSFSVRRHRIGGHVSHNSPGYAQSVRDLNRRAAEGRAMRARNRPSMFGTLKQVLGR